MDAITRRYHRLEDATRAMEHLMALGVNYQVRCRRASETYSNMPDLHRTGVTFEWTITVVDTLNDPADRSVPSIEEKPARLDHEFDHLRQTVANLRARVVGLPGEIAASLAKDSGG